MQFGVEYHQERKLIRLASCPSLVRQGLSISMQTLLPAWTAVVCQVVGQLISIPIHSA